MATRIFSVDQVDLTFHQPGQGNLLIDIQGRVVSSGWSSPMLLPLNTDTSPSDGVLGFEVLATPPPADITVLPVTTRIHAQLVLEQIDPDHFWGPQSPLKGVRCHAGANAKTAQLEPDLGMPRMRVLTDPPGGQGTAAIPSFSRDILPLFRAIDIRIMRAVRNLDLSAHDDVSAHAELILLRLQDGTMPCDGPWPDRDIAMFRTWVEAGKPA